MFRYKKYGLAAGAVNEATERRKTKEGWMADGHAKGSTPRALRR